jgi:hypothetical protein
LKLIAKGPVVQEAIYGDHGIATPPIVAKLGERGPQHV